MRSFKLMAPAGRTGKPVRRASRTGVQAVDRALRLLKEIAVDGSEGMRLSDLAARTNLDAATAHRLLASLFHQGFIEQDAGSRRYFLGLEFFSVAAAASNRYDLSDAVRASLSRLLIATGATALFQLCSGPDIVCVDMALAANDTGLQAQEMGARRPIGAGAGGIAVLAALPDLEGEDLIIRNIRRLAQDPEAAIVAVRDAMLASRRNGFAIETASSGECIRLATAVLNSDGRPQGALALAIAATGMPEPDILTLVSALLDEGQQLEDALRRLPANRTSYAAILSAA